MKRFRIFVNRNIFLVTSKVKKQGDASKASTGWGGKIARYDSRTDLIKPGVLPEKAPRLVQDTVLDVMLLQAAA